jgi:uncharacterized membrane protein YjfL (UPF0719 family)
VRVISPFPVPNRESYCHDTLGVVLEDAIVMQVLEAVGASIGWAVLGIVLLYAGVRLFDLIDPIDYREEVKRGNIAAGLTVAAVIVALAAIVTAVIVT